MNAILKPILIAILNSMMVVTFILSPIPFKQISQAQAQEAESQEKNCDDGSNTNEDGSPGIYQAGCDFNEDLATTDIKSHYPEGIKGIIEQFVGAVFALIGITLFWKPIPNALVECPQHLGAKVTFPLIQAGCLSYLIGEVSANLEFKKASKVAVDKNFQAKQDESYDRNIRNKEERDEAKKEANERKEKNNKQLAAYDSLEKIYGHQVSGLKKKIGFATAAEIAFITAEVFESTDILSNMSTGTTTVNTAIGKNLTAVGVVDSLATTIGAGSAGLCSPLTAGLVAYTKAINAYDAAAKAQAEAETAEQEVSTENQAAKTVFALEPVSFIALGSGGAVGSVGVHTTEVAKESTIATEHDAQNVEFKATRAGMISTIAAEVTACGTALAEASATSLGIGAAALSSAIAAVPLVMEAVGVVETERALPLFCSGSDTVKGVDLDTPLPTLSSLATKIDASFPEADAAEFNYFKREENLFYVKTILRNFYHRLAMYKIERENIQDPNIKIAKIAGTSEFVDFQVAEAIDLIRRTDFKKEVNQYEMIYGRDKLGLADNFLALVSDFKLQMIKSAEANAFKELLNIGIKVIALYFVLGKWLRNNAFPKPRNRIITWAIMAVVNAAVIKFDSDSKSEAEKRLSVVKKEKEKFLESHALKTNLDNSRNNSNSTGAGDLIFSGDLAQQGSGGSGVIACAVPKGNGFAPAGCPSVVPRSRFNINTSGGNLGSNGSLLSNALNGVSAVGFSAATGEQFSNPSLSEARIGSLNQQRDGLIKARKVLRKKLDDLTKKKDKKGTKIKLSALDTKFRSLYKGSAAQNGISPALAASIGTGKLPKLELEKLKEKNKNAKVSSVFTAPKFNLPNTNRGSDFDFDLGEEGGTEVVEENKVSDGAGEQDLGEFVVNAGEINENENVNIFKLISNRYLMSYPVLLDEKKK